MSKSSLKFLITPNYASSYDQRMVSGLAKGLISIGHQAIALNEPITSEELCNQCIGNSIDVVIQVNRTRDPEVKLPDNVRYISWFQDVFPETLKGFSDRFVDSDILYALGDPVVLGLHTDMPCYVGTLLTGVDQKLINNSGLNTNFEIDFSMCGFIPPPLPYSKSLLRYLLPNNVRYNTSEIMIKSVEKYYQPLCGSLDIHALDERIRESIEEYRLMRLKQLHPVSKKLAELRKKIRPKKSSTNLLKRFEKSINYFTREYPRLLDRVKLIDNILKVSGSLELYGPGWDKHAKYKKYSKGFITTQEGLLDVFKRSKINLANNTHGLGLHSRTLECMAVGGFIFMHDSPHDNKPGGMLTSFEPGIHFGSYNTSNILDEASRWIKEDKKREIIGFEARKVIKENHTWQHRASQIIQDLNM